MCYYLCVYGALVLLPVCVSTVRVCYYLCVYGARVLGCVLAGRLGFGRVTLKGASELEALILRGHAH